MNNHKLQFVEENCTITHEGKSFSSGGAYLIKNAKGKLEGILYQYPEHTIGDWKGSFKIPYVVLNRWIGNLGNKCELVSFEYLGKRFHGINYSTDNQDLVRVHEV